MAEPIGMPFGLWARMGRRNHVLDGSIGAEGRCHGNQFWDAICYNWLLCLMGYNFGCMIASDTQFDSRQQTILWQVSMGNLDPHLIHGSPGHPSPQPKRQLDRCSRFCRAH